MEKEKLKGSLSILRHDEADGMASQSPVNFEISIDGDHRETRVGFAQAYETKIGHVGVAVFIASCKFAKAIEVGRKVKGVPNESGFHCLKNCPGGPEVKRGLGENRLTGQKRLGNHACQIHRPTVVAVPAVEVGDKESRVGNTLHDFENPLRCERSRGPSRLPASSRNGFFSSSRSRKASIASLTRRPWGRPVSLDLRRIHSKLSAGKRTVNVVLIY